MQSVTKETLLSPCDIIPFYATALRAFPKNHDPAPFIRIMIPVMDKRPLWRVMHKPIESPWTALFTQQGLSTERPVLITQQILNVGRVRQYISEHIIWDVLPIVPNAHMRQYRINHNSWKCIAWTIQEAA